MTERKKRILLVEDEESLLEMIKLNLEMEGYDITTAIDGKEALDLASSARFDLCVLDIMLPKIDGITVCKTLRLKNKDIPILFLSAKSAGSDRVEGLKAGGDDYLTKPFNLEELLLRVKNIIRRTEPSAEDRPERSVYKFGDNRVDFANFEVKGTDGSSKTLSKREMHLLRFLIENEGKVVSREEILDTVWGYDVYPTTRTIDNYILAFRKLFEPDSKNPKYLHSVRGVGYKFTNSD
jgi:two-component system alkaline phosphatase synthesis response regulator PhoP